MTWTRLVPLVQGLGGAGFLLYAIALSHRLRATVPVEVRSRWGVLSGLMYFFVAGYVAFVAVVATGTDFPVALVTGAVFLGGALFAFLVIDLSRTTLDRMRAGERELEAAHAQLSAQNIELSETVHELHRLADRVRATEAHWQESFDIIDEAITIHDLDFHILRANRAAREMFGEGFETHPGLKCHQAYHGTDSPPERCPSCKTTLTGKAAQQELYEPHLERHLAIRSLPRFDRAGELVGVVHVVADISERKRREGLLAESERRYRELIEGTDDWVVRVDKSGRVTFLNRAALEGLGLPLNRCLGRPLIEFVHEDDRSRVDEALVRWARDKPDRDALELRMVDPGDEEKYLQWALHFERRGGHLVGGSGIGRDVTGRIQAERELRSLEEQLYHAQKLEAVGTLAGGIAHDFNNLLQVISGFTEMLLDDAHDEGPDRDSLVRIDQAARRGAELVRGLLAFSRKDEARLEPLDLNVEVRRAVEMLERTLPKMITLDTRPAAGLWPIRADGRRIAQVLMNLGTNAADAMGGQGTLTLETRNELIADTDRRGEAGGSPGPYVVLRVTDTGCGMSEEVRRHVFEPFFTTKEIGQGTGLGLSTVYGIVRSHGGHLRCESDPGRGTTFVLRFPAIVGEVEEVCEGETVDAPRGDETLLLVDDEEDVRMVGELALGRLGYTVWSAASGEEALAQLDDGRQVDLVVLDLGMPGMGGRRCLAEIVARHPGLGVVVASGYAGTPEAETILEAGARGFVPKPYRIPDLAKVIREVLDQPDVSPGVGAGANG